MSRDILSGGKGQSWGDIVSRFKKVKEREANVKAGNLGKCFRDSK